jgi:hypothetical protein
MWKMKDGEDRPQGLSLVELSKRCFDLRVVYSSLHRSFPLRISTIILPADSTGNTAHKQSLVSSIMRHFYNQHLSNAIPQEVGCSATLGILSDDCRKPPKFGKGKRSSDAQTASKPKSLKQQRGCA